MTTTTISLSVQSCVIVHVEGISSPITIHSLEDGRVFYEFENRGTAYTIITDVNDDYYEVWSNRKALGSRNSQVTVYESLEALTARGKIFKKLVTTIQFYSNSHNAIVGNEQCLRTHH